MKLLEKIGSAVVKKIALATASAGGFLAFAGAGTASAHPRVVVGVVVGVRVGGPVVVRGQVAPRPFRGRAMGARGTAMLITTGRVCGIGMRGLAAGVTGKLKKRRLPSSSAETESDRYEIKGAP